ncbi:MAG: Na+-transporting NADH:ubiquinone oxidoreductase, subunit NqrB, partial [Cyanobacteria bacterium P01_G01_bin.54]
MFKDARDHQIVFLSLFLTLGVAMRDWSLRPEIVAVAIGVSLVTQAGLSWVHRYWAKGEKPREKSEEAKGLPITHYPLSFNWRSPLITALGLSLLLRTDHLGTMALAASLAIASKFLFKVNGKHCFNPANFGIIAVLTLTPNAWISPGQWGEEMWYALIFLGAGGIVLTGVGRWDTTGMFLGCYALLEALRNVYLGWTWDVWMHRMS